MRITRSKSQADIELFLIIVILLLMFVIMLVVGIQRQKESQDIKDYIEKRRECLRLSSLVSSIANYEEGAKIRTRTDYVAIFYNDSITIKDIENITAEETRIAILASEAGESTQNFYDSLNTKFSPKWYKACFSDLGSGDGCQQWQGSGITDITWATITKTLDDLILEIGNYSVLYLEDPHIRDDAVYGGKTYLQIIEEWVSAGNTIILAEHVMCREQGSGTYPPTSYMCNPVGYNYDIWTVFGNNIHQGSGSYNHNMTVVIDPPSDYFPDMDLGNKYDLEENSSIEILPKNYEKAYQGSLTGTYTDSGGAYSDTFYDDNYYWYVGSDNNNDNITAYAEIIYNLSSLGISKENVASLNFSIRYCHDGSTGTAACDGDDAEGNIQGSQDVEIFNYSSSAWQDIGDLRTNDNGFEVFDSFYLNGNLSDYVSSSATISLRYEINYYNEGNADSYLVIDSAIMNMTASTQLEYPTVVAKYDADSKPAIVYWNYGAGKVFYFGDFQVEPSKQNAYSEMLADLIERAYFVTVTPAKGEISCSYTGELFTIGQFSRNIEIKNLDNKVHITQK